MNLHVLKPGLATRVVDFGRPGTRHLGVPVGGAADRASLTLGNALVGNPPDTAALEISLAGPTLRADAELACVVFGAPFTLFSEKKKLTAGTTFTLQPGEELHIGGTPQGMRAYLCVRGGLQTSMILGSRAGLDVVKAGDVLPCLPGRIPARKLGPEHAWRAPGPELHVLPGLQADWFQDSEFYGQVFTVTPASNRMGLRLQGKPLTLPPRELVSEPVAPGAVQVTNDGQCILLGVDGQTIGGYPKIAHVIAADLDAVGQLRPGDKVRFVKVEMVEAVRRFREREQELMGIVMRLRLAVEVS